MQLDPTAFEAARAAYETPDMWDNAPSVRLSAAITTYLTQAGGGEVGAERRGYIGGLTKALGLLGVDVSFALDQIRYRDRALGEAMLTWCTDARRAIFREKLRAEHPEIGAEDLTEMVTAKFPTPTGISLEAAPLYATPAGRSGSVGVNVKPLEWYSGANGSGEWSREGGYNVGRSMGRWLCVGPAIERGGRHTADVGRFDSLEEAKAAAQADYEARILSALSTVKAEPVGGEGESQPAIPDGWVLVPREPTADMCAAGMEPHIDGIGSMYRAMLAAAPSSSKNGSGSNG